MGFIVDKSIVNYDNCITNLTSSIQKHFGVQPNYSTNPIVDEELSKKHYKNVVVMIFDAMGVSILDKNTTPNHYLRKHMIGKMVSCYPPTTANCLTAYFSGKNPIETSWIGWASYFKEIDKVIENFTNREYETKELFTDFKVTDKYIPYMPLGYQIAKQTGVRFEVIGPNFMPTENKCASLKHVANRLVNICNQEGDKLIFVYWDEPDGFMHKLGTKNDTVKKILNQISKVLQAFEDKCEDSIAFISADHSQLDVQEIPLYEYKEIYGLLERIPSIDARTPSFFVKDGQQEKFKELFEKEFEGKFILLTHDEFIASGILGTGTQHPIVDSMIGDFVGLAISDCYFAYTNSGHKFLGTHAGYTKEETEIPLIIVNKSD